RRTLHHGAGPRRAPGRGAELPTAARDRRFRGRRPDPADSAGHGGAQRRAPRHPLRRGGIGRMDEMEDLGDDAVLTRSQLRERRRRRMMRRRRTTTIVVAALLVLGIGGAVAISIMTGTVQEI